MTTFTGALRRRVLTPSTSATRLDVRGFREKDPAARELLETVGRTFLEGYAAAAEAAFPAAAEPALENVPERFRGFAYEGAAMAFAVRDGLPFGSHRHVQRFLDGRGGAHVYMAYVGIGWAMARLPRFRWPEAGGLDPLLRWLVLDGYGFHQAYFHTDRYVRDQHVEDGFPWPADAERWYAPKAIDQGIGRALWFVGGTDADAAADLIDGFAPGRHADLWAGAGLAATYAGGASVDELTRFRDRAGEHRGALAQGSAFAAEARLRADLLGPHTATATEVLCGTSPGVAARLCLETRPESAAIAAPGDLPAYEVWRRRIAAGLAVIERS